MQACYDLPLTIDALGVCIILHPFYFWCHEYVLDVSGMALLAMLSKAYYGQEHVNGNLSDNRLIQISDNIRPCSPLMSMARKPMGIHQIAICCYACASQHVLLLASICSAPSWHSGCLFVCGQLGRLLPDITCTLLGRGQLAGAKVDTLAGTSSECVGTQH